MIRKKPHKTMIKILAFYSTFFYTQPILVFYFQDCLYISFTTITPFFLFLYFKKMLVQVFQKDIVTDFLQMVENTDYSLQLASYRLQVTGYMLQVTGRSIDQQTEPMFVFLKSFKYQLYLVQSQQEDLRDNCNKSKIHKVNKILLDCMFLSCHVRVSE